jgi:HlyD family secretion protein
MNDNAPHGRPANLSEADLPLNARPRNERVDDKPFSARTMVLASAVIGLIIASAIWWYMPRSALEPSKSNATPTASAPPEPAFIAALGRLEPVGGVIAVTPPLASRNAVVTEIIVDNGSEVQSGQIIALLETRSGAEAAVEQAKAEVAFREADLAKMRRTLSSDKAELEAQIALAKAQLVGIEQSVDRASRLAGSGSATQASLEELQTSRNVRTAELDQAEARRLRLAGVIDEHPDVRAALASLQASKAALRQRLAELEDTAIRAPATGSIIAVPGRIGEPAPSTGVVRLAVKGPSRAILEVHQDRVQAVRLGARVVLRTAAIEGALKGEIEDIGVEVQRQAVFDSNPAANADARVLEVRVALDDASSAVAAQLINLQVLASIETGTSR